MTKKRGIDQRQDGGSARNNRVDRVFVPASVASRPRESASQIATELLATSRAPTVEQGPDTELSLRRHLSRVQRQLSESQRELANKDDELAAEVERRLETARELEQERESRRAMQERLDELLAYQARTAGIEERLQDSIATADELVQLNERERAATAAALARVDEANVAFEETRALWNAERTMIEERNATELAQLDAQRKTAVEASAESLNAQAARLREAHEAELAELRASYEQSLATLRGDLEPKALQAHSLAEERERLIAEISAIRNESMRDIVELEESHKQEIAQATELHAAEIAALTRTTAAELARVTAERDAQIIALQQAVKSAETRAQSADEQAEALRQTLKAVQRKASELEERAAVLEASKKSLDEALERGRHVVESMLADKQQMQQQLEAAANEARRTAQERHRFVAYLEEGLALLGALPPQPEVVIEMEPDD